MPRADALLDLVLNETFLAKGSPEHFARQHREARHLDNADLGAWQPVWDVMKAARISLKQRHTLALGAALRRIYFGHTFQKQRLQMRKHHQS